MSLFHITACISDADEPAPQSPSSLAVLAPGESDVGTYTQEHTLAEMLCSLMCHAPRSKSTTDSAALNNLITNGLLHIK